MESKEDMLKPINEPIEDDLISENKHNLSEETDESKSETKLNADQDKCVEKKEIYFDMKRLDKWTWEDGQVESSSHIDVVDTVEETAFTPVQKKKMKMVKQRTKKGE